jgi:multimeric flavodoxin WrbA
LSASLHMEGFMKIAVLNGSPKGNESVTMQYMAFIVKNYPDHSFTFHNCAADINRIEKDPSTFQHIIADVTDSDCVFWAFPLYYFSVASQYMRFIELIFERGTQKAFKDRYAAVLTTSIHISDHTAHSYMNAVCDDLGMKYAGGYSAGMEDLFKENERKRLLNFTESIFSLVENQSTTTRNFERIQVSPFEYKPVSDSPPVDTRGKKVLIITDSLNEDSNLGRMTGRLKKSFADRVDVCCLDDKLMVTGCTGCIQCGYDNTCRFKEADGFVDFFNTRLKSSDVLVIAGTIGERHLSSRWKMFFDRSFFNTHIPDFIGKQVGFVFSGPLRQNSNLREIFTGICEAKGAGVVDFVTDEDGDSARIDNILDTMAVKLIRNSVSGFIPPVTFRGVGYRKIMRDEIWGKLLFPFIADYRYYREHNFFDFPQKQIVPRLGNMFMGLLVKIPPIRREIYVKMMKKEMVKPFQKLLKKL